MTKKLYITDKLVLGTRKVLPDGRVKVKVTLARSGVFDYLGRELGLSGEDANKVFKVYRPPEALFNKRTMDSFKLLPFTILHPEEMVDKKNIKNVQEGVVGENLKQVDNLLEGEIVINTDDGIKALDTMQELSIGFYAFYEFGQGTTPEGETFDAKQLALEGNHVALVPEGRCGNGCKVFDNNIPGDTNMGDKVIKIAGVDCKVADTVAPLIETAIKTADAKVVSLTEKVEQQTTTISEQEATIDSLQAEIKKAQEASDPAAIQKAVDARVSLIQKVKAFDSSIECEGKDSQTLMKEALLSKDSSLTFEGSKNEPAYIQAYFDIASEKLDDETDDPLASALQKGAKGQDSKTPVLDARKKFMAAGDSRFIGNILDNDGGS